MNRRALILGNMGIEQSTEYCFLKGVDQDLKNFYSFICSDNGGAWNEDEIICCKPNIINRTKLIDLIIHEREKNEIDYWLVFFSGHGWADKNGISYLELCPGEDYDCNISLNEFINVLGETRILLITDACRAIPIMESGGKIPSYKYFSYKNIETEYRKKCREIYCDQIMKLPLNTVYIGFSCKFGETSNDNSLYGGVYIHAILNIAKRCIKKIQEDKYRKPIMLSYSYIHDSAKGIVSTKTFGKQNPIYVCPKTNQPPFCVIP